MDLVAHVKPKGEDGAAQVAELVEALKASGDPPVLGQLQKVTGGRPVPASTML